MLISTIKSPKRESQSTIPYMTPEQQTGFWRKAGAFGGDTLSYLGGSLDKPARTLRQLLAEGRSWFGGPEHDFKASELLAWIPFSDAMGLTDAEDAAYGKDITGYDDPDSWVDDVVNFGVEVVADPLNLVTFGAHKAVTPAGKIMKRSGLLDEAVEATAKAKNVSLVDEPWKKAGLMMETSAGDMLTNLKSEQVTRLGKEAGQEAIDLIDEKFANTARQVVGDIADPMTLLDQKVSALFGRHSLNPVPSFVSKKPSMFGEHVGTFGTGKLSKAAATEMARVGDAIGQSFVGRGAKKLFSPLGYAVSRAGQDFQKKIHNLRRVSDSETVAQLADIERRLYEDDFMSLGDQTKLGFGARSKNEIVRDYLEKLHTKTRRPGGGKFDTFDEWFLSPKVRAYGKPAQKRALLKQFNVSNTKKALDELLEITDEIPGLADEVGLPLPSLQDMYVQHFFRQANPKFKQSGLRADDLVVEQTVDLSNVSSSGRREELKNIPGGTSALTRASYNKRLSGWKQKVDNYDGKTVPDVIREQVKKFRGGELVPDRRFIDHPFAPGKKVIQILDPNNAEHAKYIEAKVDEIANYLGDINPKYSEFNTPAFNVNPVKDARDYLKSIRKSMLNAATSVETMAASAKPASQFLQEGVEHVPISEVFRQIGLQTEEGATQGALKNLFKAIEIEDVNKGIKQIPADLPDDYDELVALLGEGYESLSIPKNLADDLIRIQNVFTQKKTPGILSQLYDKYFNAWKIGVTTRYPLFHIRNSMGGQFNNLLIGGFSLESKAAAMSARMGGIIPNASEDYVFEARYVPKGLESYVVDGKVTMVGPDPLGVIDAFRGTMPDEELVKYAEDALATQMLIYQAEAKNVINKDMFLDRAGLVSSELETKHYISPDTLEAAPRQAKGDFDSATAAYFNLFTQNMARQGSSVLGGDQYGTWSGTLLDVLTGGVSGSVIAPGSFGGRQASFKDMAKASKDGNLGKLLATSPEVDSSKIVAFGKQVGDLVEYDNRMSPFLKLLKDGYSVDEAAAAVGRAQVDYSLMSQFERDWMNRLIPFYSFTKGMAPFIVEELVGRPGGLLSKSIMLPYQARRRDEDLPMAPSYIRQGMGFKVPGMEGRYVPSLGLPYESVFELLPGMGDDVVSGTYKNLLLKVAPPLRAGLEAGFDKDLYFEKPLYQMGGSGRQGFIGAIPGTGRAGPFDLLRSYVAEQAGIGEDNFLRRTNPMFGLMGDTKPIKDMELSDVFTKTFLPIRYQNYWLEKDVEQEKYRNIRDQVRDFLLKGEDREHYRSMETIYPNKQNPPTDPMRELFRKSLTKGVRGDF